ncbi:hypothetical protein SRHO_G00260060 [Serrasalmus rhombeus]
MFVPQHKQRNHQLCSSELKQTSTESRGIMNSTPAAETKNHTMSQTLTPSSCRDAVCIFYAVAEVIICVLGIAGNGLVIWIAGIKVKKSVVSTWYLSLAVSDFIFCSTLPFIVVYVVNKDWPFGFFMCKFSANSCLNPFLYAFMGKDVKEQCYAFRSKIENAIKEEEDQNANQGTAITASESRGIMNSTPAAETKNHTMSQTSRSSSCDAECVFYVVAEVIICVLGIAGNGLVIWIAGFKVKKSVVSTWYLSLAVSDFIFCSTLPLFSVVYVVNKDWPFGFFMCKFRSFILWLNMYSSIFLLVIISVDCCVLVMFPVWARNKRTIRKATVIVVLAWIVAAVCSTPSAVFRVFNHKQQTCNYRYTYEKNYIAALTCRFVSLFLIPFLIMFICYVLIIRKLFNQRASANSCLNPFLYAFMGKDVKEQCYAFRSKIENAIKEEEDQNANQGTAITASGERQHSTSI